MQLDTGWSKGQRALLRFLEQQGVLGAEPSPPGTGRPTNADLFATFAEAIDQQALVDLVSQALRIAPIDIAAFSPMPELVSLIPPDVARDGEVVPIAQRDGVLEVAASNPLDLEMVKSVEFTTGLRVRTKIACRADVCRALREAYGGPDAAEESAGSEASDVDVSTSPVAAEAIASPDAEDLAVASPDGADPDGADPDGADPAVVDPAVVDPDVVDPDVVDPDVADPDAADLAGADVFDAEPSAASPIAEDSSGVGVPDEGGSTEGPDAFDALAEETSAEPIRWSFDAGADASVTDADTGSEAEQARVAMDADLAASVRDAGEAVDDAGDSADDPETSVPVYELDISLDEDAEVDFSEFDDVQLSEPEPAAPVWGASEPRAATEPEPQPETDVEPAPPAWTAAEPLPIEPAEPETDVEPAAPAWTAAEPLPIEPVVPERADAREPEPAEPMTASVQPPLPRWSDAGSASADPAPVPAPRRGRPAVLIVSRELSRRVALRAALETEPDAPCVLTMRDAIEARAVLDLGGVTVVLVEGGALAADGRPLWELVRGHGSQVVVWGGRPSASDVEALDHDADVDQVAGRLRALAKESVDD